MVLASLTERVSVLSGGDRGLGGWKLLERDSPTLIFHLCTLTSLLCAPQIPPGVPNVPQWRCNGGNQWVWIARAHYMTAGH